MIDIYVSESGQVKGLPDSLRPGDDLTFNLHGVDIDLNETPAAELTLSLQKPYPINEGEFTFTYGANSTPAIPAEECTAYNLNIALNDLASIVSAGGVEVYDDRDRLIVHFLAVGSRNAFTAYHSILGTLSGRSVVLVAGNDNHRASIELDLTCQVLAQSTSSTNLDAVTVTVTEINEGDADEQQRDRITIAGKPSYGKFQVWIDSETATQFLSPDISAYQMQCALNSLEDDFTVSRRETNADIRFDIIRNSVGANASPSVSNTFLGPIGITMDMDCTKVLQLLNAAGVKLPKPAILTFRYDSQAIFSHPVNLLPILLDQGQPI